MACNNEVSVVNTGLFSSLLVKETSASLVSKEIGIPNSMDAWIQQSLRKAADVVLDLPPPMWASVKTTDSNFPPESQLTADCQHFIATSHFHIIKVDRYEQNYMTSHNI